MNQESFDNTNLAEAKCKLANIWQVKGRIELATAGYQEALRLQPDYIPAYESLANLSIHQNRMNEAIQYYEKALSINFEATDLSVYYIYLGLSLKIIRQEDIEIYNSDFLQAYYIKDNPNGKINLSSQKEFDFHRSGWNFALNALKPLHNSQGILFDGFIENNFVWDYGIANEISPLIVEKMKRDGVFNILKNKFALEKKLIVPYTQPWAGFIHNPQEMPTWLYYESSPQKLFTKDIWKKSLYSCIGLFAFSEYHAQWLREQTGKIVSTLIHPTEIPEIQFNFHKFLENPEKKVVQIGWWLRKLSAIYQLPIAKNNVLNFEKLRLIPMYCDNADEQQEEIIAKEIKINNLKIEPAFSSNTKEIKHISNTEYDILLSENIAFMELYDSSVNNAVIECIARGTPLLINPLPAVVEYLGKDYPMYFTSLSEAAKKAVDTSLILDTHNYLINCETRNKLSQEYFLKSFEESEVYQLI
ncbi:MAG: tetratricopeptide repeat protein [Nostoc sp. ChiSLP02]|nr:tetratricopeptide repeat protein [Nostoc sp. DedSLP05]MDZ8099605.1 tetratricopeptide repeat protein [Nostoc sp. DedSLP01]MDZ8188158.1 tetratricopeptide repeat protein [Nostoc sp. ChiSLP02]